MRFLVFAFLVCSSLLAADYEVLHGRDGKVTGIRSNRDGFNVPISLDNRHYREFLVWNAAQGVNALVVADRAPDPIPPAELERQRKLALAITYVKNVPEAWENGTNDQKVIWAIKQILRDIKGQLDE